MDRNQEIYKKYIGRIEELEKLKKWLMLYNYTVRVIVTNPNDEEKITKSLTKLNINYSITKEIQKASGRIKQQKRRQRFILCLPYLCVNDFCAYDFHSTRPDTIHFADPLHSVFSLELFGAPASSSCAEPDWLVFTLRQGQAGGK